MGEELSCGAFPYTKEDFEQTTKPFEDIYRLHGDPFQEKRMLERVAQIAKSLKVTDFKKTYLSYVKSIKVNSESITDSNMTSFDDQELELDTGEWTADDSGIWRYGSFGGQEIACSHPIMPVERLKNIDTGELKIRLAFRRGKQAGRRVWSEILTDFDTVSNAKNIVALSKIGVSVTSGKRAQNLVDYIAEVLDRNYDLIPEQRSVSRMGWNEEGFSPYVDNIVFDGNANFSRTFNAIAPRGSFDVWLLEALDARKYSITARIVLASSFASVLVEPLGCLPFFVHLWGMDSATGKTVGQMLAAAVWANPSVGGDYFKTFKGTSVGYEITAGFLNSLPLFIDELQLSKDSRGRVIFNVYELAAGSGKLRSNKSLGLASSPTWANCFITSGETPLVGENDGAGALNRVIEIECKADNKVIQDGHRTANAVKANYGYAGKIFVSQLMQNMDVAKQLYESSYEACLRNDTTEKQSMAAALIVTADKLATDWIFRDGRQLTIPEIAGFLKSKEAVSAAQRGYAYMCDWVAQNANKLQDICEKGETFGLIGSGDDAGWVFIIRSVFNKACSDAGISSTALLSHLKTRRLIRTRGRAMTKNKRISGVPTECVCMKLPVEDNGSDACGEELPL